MFSFEQKSIPAQATGNPDPQKLQIHRKKLLMFHLKNDKWDTFVIIPRLQNVYILPTEIKNTIK